MQAPVMDKHRMTLIFSVTAVSFATTKAQPHKLVVGEAREGWKKVNLPNNDICILLMIFLNHI